VVDWKGFKLDKSQIYVWNITTTPTVLQFMCHIAKDMEAQWQTEFGNAGYDIMP